MKLLIVSETIHNMPHDNIEQLVRGIEIILLKNYGVKSLKATISLGYIRVYNDDDENFDVETLTTIQSLISDGLSGLVSNLQHDVETVQ